MEENFNTAIPPFDECVICPVYKKFGRCPHYVNGVCPLPERELLGKIFVPLNKALKHIECLKRILSHETIPGVA
jgi:hypothetical protein